MVSASSGPSESSKSRRESSESSEMRLERIEGEYIGEMALRGDLRLSSSVAFGVEDVIRIRRNGYRLVEYLLGVR